MTPLIAVLERLEKRYANEHAQFVLGMSDSSRVHAIAASLVAMRDLCREIRLELQADAKALPECGGG